MFKSVVLSIVSLVAMSAGAETMEWNFESRSPIKAQLSFFSTSGNREWPGNGKSYTLYEWRDYQYRLECNYGEKICYGASTIPNGQYTWGVGVHNTKSCTSCCVTCGSGPVKMVLNP